MTDILEIYKNKNLSKILVKLAICDGLQDISCLGLLYEISTLKNIHLQLNMVLEQ